MSSFASTGVPPPVDDNVDPTPSAPTTEPPQPATSELNIGVTTQPSEQPFLAASYSENIQNAPTVGNDGLQPPSMSTSEMPSANAAQFASPAEDAFSTIPVSTDIDSNSAPKPDVVEESGVSIAPPNVDTKPPAWDAAQNTVGNIMASENTDRTAPTQPTRGRGRGRPRTSNLPNGDRNTNAEPGPGLEADPSLTTPIRRGRGGRPRGRGSARSKGKAARKRRGDGAGGDMSDSEELSDDSGQQAKDPIVTKSGRSITKPSQYNPVVEPSPSSGTKRKRSQQPKFADQIWCIKCLRGHSPPSNQIVLCDGCDAAYHQWCHDPLIDKEVAEDIHQSWFCGNCLHAKEIKNLSLQQRVPSANLTVEEKTQYLSLLPKPTLVELLVHGTSLHPDLPLFAQNTRQILQSIPKSQVPRPTPVPPLPTPPSSQSLQQHQATQNLQMNPHSQHMQPHPQQSPINQEHNFPHDAYPEYSNEAGDPPATYPRPGRGPIKLQATTHPEDHPWMFQDNYEVFSHLVNDGTGRLVPMQQRPEGWPGMPGQNGNPQQQPGPPQHHPPPDYRQHMYNAPPPPPHPHPPMQYAAPVPAPHPYQNPQQQHPQQQWSPAAAYGMPPPEHMAQQHPQQPQQQHPSHPGAMPYGGGGGGGGGGSPTMQ